MCPACFSSPLQAGIQWQARSLNFVAHVNRSFAVDGLDAAQASLAGAEQADPAAQQYRRDVEHHFVDQPGGSACWAMHYSSLWSILIMSYTSV